MKLSVVLLLMLYGAAIWASAEKPIDEILSEAAGGPPGGSEAAPSLDLLSDSVRYSEDRATIITELDIAHRLPCEYTSPNNTVVLSVAGESTPPLMGECDPEILPLESGSAGRRGSGRGGRSKRNIKKGTGIYWTNKRIPYTISNVHDSGEMGIFNEVKAAYSKHTCIDLVPRTNERDYISIIKGGGCWSYVGKVGGAQQMSLDRGCLYHRKTAIHEFLHALGFWHEQSRPDRDSYIDIHLANVNSNLHHNFRSQKDSDVDLFGTKYDYRSVMHYSRTAFSNNRKDTITTKNPKFLDIIGRGPTFSFYDLYILHLLYKCDSGCSSTNNCPAGSYRGSDCKCYCPNDEVDNNIPSVLCNKDPVTTASPETTTTESPTSELCKEPNDNCNCKAVPRGRARECMRVRNSRCEAGTGRCICALGYEVYKVPGRLAVCRRSRVPRCKKIGFPCECQNKHLPCTGLDHTSCSKETGACECNKPDYTFDGRKCKKTINGQLHSTDGSRVPPFENQPRVPNRWVPDRGNEPDMQFGLSKNGYRLSAVGRGDRDWASLMTPPLPPRNSNNEGWCVEFNYNLNYGALYIEFSPDRRRWYNYNVFHMEGNSPVYIPKVYKFQTRYDATTIRFGARSYPWRFNGIWRVNLDPIKVYAC